MPVSELKTPRLKRSPLPAKQNQLLGALSAAEVKRLTPHLEPIEMALGQVVYESGRVLDYVYFPTTCIISLLAVMENGSSAEIAIVGKEGLVGISLFMAARPRQAARWCSAGGARSGSERST